MVDVELREGATVEELIDKMAERIRDENRRRNFEDAVRSSVFVLNGKAVTRDERLRDRDTVLQLPRGAWSLYEIDAEKGRARLRNRKCQRCGKPMAHHMAPVERWTCGDCHYTEYIRQAATPAG